MHSRRRSYFLPLMALLIALAWIVLWTWEQSPYGRYINHGQFGALNQDSAICRVFDAGTFRDTVLPAVLFLLGWLLMCWAMMLPTTLPLLRNFRRLTSRRPDRNLLIVLAISGYMAIWLAFGIAAHALYSLIYWVIDDSLWLQINGWMLGVGVLLLAGGFQFSSLKSHCLEQCHAPQGFVTRYWSDGAEPRHALQLGLAHGLYCVGCCWAMMSLMFVVGTGSVGWMLLLGAVMAVEKNLTWGRRLSAPLGVILVIWAGAIAVQHLGIMTI
jgi:predicted metal-binding membrane protein